VTWRAISGRPCVTALHIATFRVAALTTAATKTITFSGDITVMIRSDSSIPDSPATFAAGAGFMEVKPLGSRRRALLMAHDEDVAQVLSWEPHAVGSGGYRSSAPRHVKRMPAGIIKRARYALR